MEMSALSSLFATHVQAQAEQIESLYQEAIDSSRHFDMGNVEMKKTIARKATPARRSRHHFAHRDDRAVVSRLVLWLI